MARLETIAGIDLAAIEHDIEGLRGVEPGHRDAGRWCRIDVQHAAMAQFRNATDEPGDFARLNRKKLTQENSHPERRSHHIIGHTDALALEMRQARDS